MPRIAIIAGSGLETSFSVRESSGIDTPYGFVNISMLDMSGRVIVFLQRHGPAHSVPPHRINYRANIFALKKADVEFVIATNAVGSLRRRIRPGDFIVPDQMIEFTKLRPSTFFEGEDGRVIHTDMTEPYSVTARNELVKSCQERGWRVHTSGVYVCAEGPRYETPAEITMFRRLGGDIVGMTGYPEAVLAKELGLKYATLCVATNYAAGLQQRISHDEVVELMGKSMGKVKQVVEDTVTALSSSL